jgi:pimeloyl-ACP methyl ester carboxylesterase
MSSEVIGQPRTRRRPAGPRFGEVASFSTKGYHRIAYTEWGAPDAARVAVCVHGLTRQGRDFDPLALALAQRGYRVLCPDLAGRGRSQWLADPADYDLPQYTRDMVVLLARAGGQEVDWVGSSLGGLIGIQLASQPKTPIRRMVINDVGPFLPSQALSRLGRYLWSMPKSFANFHAAEAYFREILAPYGVLGDSEWYHLTAHSIRRGEDGRFRLLIDPGVGRAIRPAMAYSMSMWRQWDALRCPVLILRGQYSDMLTADISKQMLARGPASRLIEFPDCGHAPALLNLRQIAPVVQWLTRNSDEGATRLPAA